MHGAINRLTLIATLALAGIDGANAATESELAHWAGCYDITLHAQDDSGARDSRLHAQLTTELLPTTGGSYRVLSLDGPDARWAGMSYWWPGDGESVFVALTDGFTGWSATLFRDGTMLRGTSAWFSDSGTARRAWEMRAQRIDCR